MKTEQIKTYECTCYAPEHQLTFNYIQHFNQEFYVTVFMSPSEGFFGRIWLALKYVFGYKPQWGHFGQWSLQERDLDGIIKLLQDYKQDMVETAKDKPSLEEFRQVCKEGLIESLKEGIKKDISNS